MVSWNGLPVPVHSCVSRAVGSVHPYHSRAIDSGCIVTFPPILEIRTHIKLVHFRMTTLMTFHSG